MPHRYPNRILLALLILFGMEARAQFLAPYCALNGYAQPKYYRMDSAASSFCGGFFFSCVAMPTQNLWDVEAVRLLQDSAGMKLFLGRPQGFNYGFGGYLASHLPDPYWAPWFGDSVRVWADGHSVSATLTVFPQAQLGDTLVKFGTANHQGSFDMHAVLLDSLGRDTVLGQLDSIKIGHVGTMPVILSKNHGWVVTPPAPAPMGGNAYFRQREGTRFVPYAYSRVGSGQVLDVSVGDAMHMMITTDFQLAGAPGIRSYYRAFRASTITAIDTIAADTIRYTVVDSTQRLDSLRPVQVQTNRYLVALSDLRLLDTDPFDTTSAMINPYFPYGTGTTSESRLGRSRFFDQNTYFEGGAGAWYFEHWPLLIRTWVEFNGGPSSLFGNIPTYFRHNGQGRGTPGTFIAGLKPNRNVLMLRVSPNPAQGKVRLESAGLRGGTVLLLNPQGARVWEMHLNTGTEIDVSGLSTGLYRVIVQDSQGRFGTESLSVERR